MFGGIIRHQGRLAQVDLKRGKLRISAPRPARYLKPGDSIAVDGVCLTVTTRGCGFFSVDMTPETVRRTNFRWARPGWVVNLELPLRLSDRIHGHPVLGHVDGVGVVKSMTPVQSGRVMSVWVPMKLSGFMAEKGSVAINGVSLTIARRYGRLIQISLIPETLRRTNFRFLGHGARVNLEVDVIARYTLGRRKSMLG